MALELRVENWRWAGVPFFLRTGKRLARTVTEIAVQFKRTPHSIFRQSDESVAPNVIVMRFKPDEGIRVTFSAKVPGEGMRTSRVRMDFDYEEAFGVELPDAYETLLLDAMQGDPMLFTRRDEVEAQWGVVEPILDAWESADAPEFPNYAAGSSGPEARRPSDGAARIRVARAGLTRAGCRSSRRHRVARGRRRRAVRGGGRGLRPPSVRRGPHRRLHRARHLRAAGGGSLRVAGRLAEGPCMVDRRAVRSSRRSRAATTARRGRPSSTGFPSLASRSTACAARTPNPEREAVRHEAAPSRGAGARPRRASALRLRVPGHGERRARRLAVPRIAHARARPTGWWRPSGRTRSRCRIPPSTA